MGAIEEDPRRYPRPASNDRFVWEPSGRIVDLQTGDYLTTQSAGPEYRQSILHLRDKRGALAAVYGLQLNYGDYKPRKPFPVSITYVEDHRAGENLEWAQARISVERLASFLAAWPALNQSDTNDFFVAEIPARMGGN